MTNVENCFRCSYKQNRTYSNCNFLIGQLRASNNICNRFKRSMRFIHLNFQEFVSFRVVER